jgi:membrane-bound serine protease (ClpP class)
MHSGSSIGAATVVNQSGEVQPDKYQSYMRSLMRTTAETRGRRPDIAEAMVDPDIEVKDIIDSGKVLTFTTEEAIANNYCEGQAESIAELLKITNITNYIIEEQHYTLVEKMINFLINPMISGLLIMLIIGGIYFEFQSPGIGFPVAMAILGALLYFAPLYLEGLAANWEIIIFIQIKLRVSVILYFLVLMSLQQQKFPLEI